MTRESFNSWLSTHTIQLLVGVVSLTLAWATMSAKVERKADKTEVETLRTLLERVDERTVRIERFLCRPRPDDLGC